MHLRHLCLPGGGGGGANMRKVHGGAKIRSGPPGCKILDTRLLPEKGQIIRTMCVIHEEDTYLIAVMRGRNAS